MMMEMVLVLAVVLMETPEGGTEKTFGGDSGGVSPLRSSPTVAFYLLFRDFVFLRRPLRNSSGDYFYSRF